MSEDTITETDKEKKRRQARNKRKQERKRYGTKLKQMFTIILEVIIITVYVFGSKLALELYHERVKFEKVAKEEYPEYKLRFKYTGYVIVGLFSWLSYIALKRQT